MWQLFYIIDFFPDILWHLLTLVSFVVLIATAMIRIIPYRLPIGVFSALLFSFCIWTEGGLANEQKWLEEIAKLQEAVKAAEEKARQANSQIQTEIVEKEKVIVKRGETIVKEIDKIVEVPGPERVKEVTKDMSEEQRKKYEDELAQLRKMTSQECALPKPLIDVHNEAAKNPAATKGEKK
jgi:flagellar biosynthesis component FlhA